MKFMQRSADRAQADAERKVERRRIDESHWRATYADDVVGEDRARVQVVYEPSYLRMPGGDTAVRGDGTQAGARGSDGASVTVGRRSFKSFNAQAEDASRESNARQRDEHAGRMEVDDAAMAEAVPSRTAEPAPQQPRSSRTARKRS
ncbi:hypothetical protein LPJ61_001720 [Coemansia biformis]|uniref:Uncharacterized protein n=1 Tax=Coemansia biformis TaxID=1286918 RepID=A0A9W7YFG0_9FUNG|nr:hypothetical protein LPJ61_001720 [Coemansia biformis]